MTIKPFHDQGNYTSVHNAVFDQMLPALPPNAFKVLCFIIRKTVGWHKPADDLSYSQLLAGTGIKARATLSTAIKELVDRRYIIATRNGEWETSTYQLNTKLEIPMSSSKIAPAPSAEFEPMSSSKIAPAPSAEFEHTKETLKKRGRKGEQQPNAQPAQQLTPAQQALFAAAASACGWGTILTERQHQQLAEALPVLESAGATPEDLASFAGYWFSSSNELYKVKGDAIGNPYPSNLANKWGQFRAWQQAQAKRQQRAQAAQQPRPAEPAPSAAEVAALFRELPEPDFVRARGARG